MFEDESDPSLLRGLINTTWVREIPEEEDYAQEEIACPHPCVLEYDTASNQAIQLEVENDDYYDNASPTDGLSLPQRVQLAGKYEPHEDYDGCHFINPRHDLHFPTCTKLHELDFAQPEVTFINCGGARCAFYFPDANPQQQSSSPERIVVKSQKWKKVFEEKRSEKARKDGVIMEQATHSPFIMDVYGTCGTSQLLEYSPRGSLHDHVKLTRIAGKDTMSPVDKLKIVIQIASAVADLHDPSVAIAHGDICGTQFLWKDGFYKLNDFHMSSFLKEDANHTICRGRNQVANHELLWRAPEESAKKPLDQQKVDLFMMGFPMYYVYTKNWLYEGIPEIEAKELFHTNKTVSSFPAHLDTTIPANAAMQSAIEQCWAFEPQDRPTASAVRDFLLQELSKILGRTVKPGDDVLRVEIPPLPRGHRFTDSSMDNASAKRKPRKHIRYRDD